MSNFSTNETIERLLKIYSVRTMKELSLVLGGSESLVANWNKRDAIPFENLVIIAREKNVSLDWLVYGKEDNARTLNPLEELILTAFNALDDKAKLQMISLMNNGGQSSNGVNQVSGDHGVNNYQGSVNIEPEKRRKSGWHLPEIPKHERDDFED